MKKINFKSLALCAAMLSFGFAVNHERILGDDASHHNKSQEACFLTDPNSKLNLTNSVKSEINLINRNNEYDKLKLSRIKEIHKINFDNLYEFVIETPSKKGTSSSAKQNSYYYDIDTTKINNIKILNITFLDPKSTQNINNTELDDLFIQTGNFSIIGKLIYPNWEDNFYALEYDILSKKHEALIHVKHIFSSVTSGKITLSTVNKDTYSLEEFCLEMYLSCRLTINELVAMNQQIIQYPAIKKFIKITPNMKDNLEESTKDSWNICINNEMTKIKNESDELYKIRDKFLIRCLKCNDPATFGACISLFTPHKMNSNKRMVISDFSFIEDGYNKYTLEELSLRFSRVRHEFSCKAYFYNMKNTEIYFNIVGYKNDQKLQLNTVTPDIDDNTDTIPFFYCLYSPYSATPLASVYYTPFSENSGYIKIGICDDKDRRSELKTIIKKQEFLTNTIYDADGLIETKSINEFREKLLHKYHLSIEQLIYLSQKIVERIKIEGKFDYTMAMSKEGIFKMKNQLF